MPRKNKENNQSVPLVLNRPNTGDSFPDSLRALVHGLFGSKPQPFKPTQQQIADYYLTPREREVAYLAALGFSHAEIADALGMNFQTVRVHLRNVLNKMELDQPRQLRDYFSRPSINDDANER